MAWHDEYMQLIEDCEAREDRLSDWGRNFIDSIRRQIESGKSSLSPKQIETLSNIWEEATKRG